MADKYKKFINAETEISLDENDNTDNSNNGLSSSNVDDVNGCTKPDEYTQLREDIGPENGECDADLECDVVVYRKKENTVDSEAQHTIEIPESLNDDRLKPLTGFSGFRQRLRHVLEHLAFRIVTVFLVILDVVIVIVDLSMNDTIQSIEIFSLIIMSYFMLECILRLTGQGPLEFFKHWIETVDAVIIVVSFVFTILPLALPHMNANIAFIRLFVAARLIRIVLIIRLISEKRNLERATRKIVSQNKRRYQKDGFDLDLCYITERVIAMSFPSTGLMAFYRNPIKEVAKFLDSKHPNKYMVYNLCSERMYDESLFHNRVMRIRIDDHNVPKLQELLDFVQCVRQWLEADPGNVISVHCKGGKGRTGTMICTWLVESGSFQEAGDSLEFFGDRRTDLSVGDKFQGVETPSQSRYVGYFEKIKRLHMGSMPPEQTLKLTSIYIKTISGVGCGDGRDLTCKIITSHKIWVYDLWKQDNCEVVHNLGADTVAMSLHDTPVLEGDIKVMFFCSDKTAPRGYDDCLFYFWFHTSFIEEGKLFLARDELDNPHKKKTWNVFNDEFSITLLFQKIEKI